MAKQTNGNSAKNEQKVELTPEQIEQQKALEIEQAAQQAALEIEQAAEKFIDALIAERLEAKNAAQEVYNAAVQKFNVAQLAADAADKKDDKLNAEAVDAANIAQEAISDLKKANAAVIPPYMKTLLIDRKIEDDANNAKLAELEAAQEQALMLHVERLQADKFKQTPAVIEAAAAAQSIANAIEDHNKQVKLLELQRNENDSKQAAKFGLADIIGLSIDQINALLSLDAEKLKALKANFNAVFGKADIHIRQGATGVNLTANASTGATNGTGAKSDKWAEATADLAAGMTHDALLQKYPTHKTDGTVDYTKLNGTVRTVIYKDGWSLQADKTYAKK